MESAFGLPSALVDLVLGIGGLIAGGVWLLRIARETGRDERSSWRYRDH
jgi:hypothetical protein